MMASLKKYLNDFFAKFSYSSKVKFVIFSAAISAIILAAMLKISQDNFIRIIQFQINGLKIHRELIHLYDLSLHEGIYILQEKNEDFESPYVNKINEEIAKVDALIHQSDELTKLFSTYLASWHQFENSQENSLFFIKESIKTIEHMIAKNQKNSYLTINFDIGTQRFVVAFLNHLVDSQSILFDILQKIKTISPQNPIDKASILVLLEKLKENGVEMMREIIQSTKENSFLFESAENSFLLVRLENFNQYIDHFSAIVRTQLDQPDQKDLSLIFSSGEGVLTSSIYLNQEGLIQLKKLFETQLNTFRARETFATISVILGVLLVLLFYVTRVIRLPLSELEKAAQELASGNLNARVKITTNDEVAQMSNAFNHMAEFFAEMIKKVDLVTNNVCDSSTKISKTAKELGETVFAEEQSIAQVKKNVKRISRNVREFARTLPRANFAASITSNLVTAGRQGLGEMETLMQQIMEGSSKIVLTLSSLEQKVEKVQQVIRTIVEIVDQANLLSLNAALISNRRGIQGAGFSIVANKIKELADQTARVTLHIEEGVNEVFPAVTESVSGVKYFAERVQSQVSNTTQINEQLENLIRQTQYQIGKFEEANQGMQTQANSAGQIEKSVVDLSQDASQITDSAHQLYLEIERLHQSTLDLNNAVKTFQISAQDKE